jgi:Neuraminidase (sialidase)
MYGIWLCNYNVILDKFTNKQLHFTYKGIEKLITNNNILVLDKIQDAIILKMIEHRLRYS